MTTECSQVGFEFHPLNQRQIRARFDGGAISRDGGGLLLREVEQRMGIIRQFAACFTDYRDPERIEPRLEELVAQRVYGLALGYEDLNDHDQLRRDPLLAVRVEKSDPSQAALAGKSSLNRLELTQATASSRERYQKIVLHHGAVDRRLGDLFLEAHPQAPEQIIVDLDATDDPLYGQQEGRCFHRYYGHSCYLPLYIFCGEFWLCARLRPSHLDGSAGSVEELQRMVKQIRCTGPQVRLIVRGDSGCCGEERMAWGEAEGVDSLLGLAKNDRLKAAMQPAMEQAQVLYRQSGQAARVFPEFGYPTRQSWSRARRVVAKAEYLEEGENPRFIVTSLGQQPWPAQPLYEEHYCARGDMENRIKEQLMLFSDRSSTAYLRSNQLRLYFSALAYVLLQRLRRLGLDGTELAKAQCATIRLKLLKIGALIRITVRKVWVSLAGGYP
jgi:Transposase DDE domain group 1